jgi:hypothetical protein
MSNTTLKVVDGVDNGNDDSGKPDPFDLKALREQQSLIPVKRRRLSIPVVRKPNRHRFVRVHPDPEYRIDIPVFRPQRDEEGRGDDEIYFVHPSVLHELEAECRIATIFTAVTLQGNPFLWCVMRPIDDGRDPNSWLVSNREAAEVAMTKWVRVASDMAASAYETHEYEGAPPPPKFPRESFQELLRLGFKHHLIDRADHPVILGLRGL